ncbi:SLBB domain-containing protein, partial [Gammaproteobacteria bacterium]|nr:SLBB domain-containing protein [Gammaproteobacteria bacterium]
YLLILFSIPQLMAQNFPDNFSADLQNQFFELTPEQRETIAAQYGIDLNDMNNSTQEKYGKSSMQSGLDERFLNDQQQNIPTLSSNPLYEDYRENKILMQNNFLAQQECFDEQGNLFIPETQTKKKLDKRYQDKCYNRFGRLLDYPDYDMDVDADLDDYILKDEEDEGELSRFGMSVFNKKISTFSPFENVPVPDDYILGAGDEISIKLVGSENSLLNLRIGRNGAVFVPKIGEITLSGISFEEAINIIKSRIEGELIGVDAYVTMGRIKSINIFMAGEVSSPGMYSISALSTITQSLYQAGGISDIGSLRNIKVLRSGKEITVFDVYDLLIYGNSKNDIRLRSGDVVFIPPYEGLIEARGSVKRSHIFEIKTGDTFTDLLKWIGGFDSNAYPAAASLTRSNSIGEMPTVSNIDLLLNENLAKKLQANDLISIPEMSADQRAYVSVEGAFNRPGKFGWFQGMKIVDILSNQTDYLMDFSNETDFDIALIERFDQKTKTYSVLQFSPIDLFNEPDSKSNIELSEFDTLYFLPRNLIDRFLLLQPFVKRLSTFNTNGESLNLFAISGDVKFPGTYPLPSNITLIEAIQLAGGSSDTAFLDSIEISRITKDSGLIRSKVFEVSALNSSLEASNFKILPRDRINVRANEELTMTKSFTLKGFVRFPGSYPLNTDETLLSAINRAGGLKDNAFADGARLIRKSLIDIQTKQNKDLAASIRTSYASSLLTSENNSSSIQDIQLVAKIIEEIEGEGRVVINLDEALSGNKKYNIDLEDGDILIIPQSTNIINIIGEVRNPNVVNFVNDLDTDDYLNLAGGLTQRADGSNAYIIRANGSIISLQKSIFSLGLSRPKFKPGDTLVVPIKQNYQDPLPLWSQVTQIIYQSMVSISAVKGL